MEPSGLHPAGGRLTARTEAGASVMRVRPSVRLPPESDESYASGGAGAGATAAGGVVATYADFSVSPPQRRPPVPAKAPKARGRSSPVLLEVRQLDGWHAKPPKILSADPLVREEALRLMLLHEARATEAERGVSEP